MGLFNIMLAFESDMHEIQRMNREKVDECYHRYFITAPTLPRKKKKAMRKQANKDYRFWKGIQQWQEEKFSF